MKTEQVTQIEIPLRTILTVLLTLALVKLFEITASLLLSLVIAGMIAISLEPVLRRLRKMGLARGAAVGLLTALLCAGIAAFAALVLPKIYVQSREVYEHLPQIKQEILGRLPVDSQFRTFIERGLRRENILPKSINLQEIMGAGNAVLGGFADLLLIFVLTIYLLADGPRMIAWITAFFAPSTQSKIQRTNSEVSDIVSAYIAGQAITSFLSFLFVLIALNCLGVSNTLLLATLSGLLDVLPVLGFVIAVVPAMFFALQVSMPTSLIVMALYLFYHAFENYVIVPYVYGRRLRVAGLVVFLGLLLAGLVAGVKGAIAVLPFLAAYPVIERIWLKGVVREEAIRAHK